MNERDSELVEHDLVKNGYELASNEEGADIVLLNTCSVREQAEQKAIGKANHIISKTEKRRMLNWAYWVVWHKIRVATSFKILGVLTLSLELRNFIESQNIWTKFSATRNLMIIHH